MPFDEFLADRIRSSFKKRRVSYDEKKMFGGLCFMVDDKMCIGINGDDLMARINPEVEEEALTQKGARPMDFTGRPMKGFVFVGSDGIDLEEDLEYWIRLCLDYNPLARSSKKKKKK